MARVSSQLAPGLLVASPPLGDPNFDRTVILLAIHNEHGALGFVINRLAPLQIGELLGLAGYGEGLGEIRGAVYVGGPVEPSSGWVLGSRDSLGLAAAPDSQGARPIALAEEEETPARPRTGGASGTTRAASVAAGRGGAGALVKEAVAGDGEGVIAVGDDLVVTSSRKVFDEVARRAKDGEDPDDPRRLVILGYSGWGPGQLEGEIARGAWLPLPLDERILFATDPAARWDRMFEMLGVTALGAASMRTIGSA
jgi:putative transcriptional regulator